MTVRPSAGSIPSLRTITAEGLHAVVTDPDTGTSHLELRTPAGTTHEVDLPDLTERTVLHVGVAPGRAAFLVDQQRKQAWWYEIFEVDRTSGAGRWTELPEQLRGLGYTDAGVLVGDELVVAGSENGYPGRLLVVSTRDGGVREIALPVPDDPELASAPKALWPDPRRPGDVIVAYSFQHFEQLETDSFLVVIVDRFVARLDVATGTWETLLHTNPWRLDPAVRAHGVTADGRVVVRIDVSDDGALLGVLDGDTGELRVSGSVCLADDEVPWFVHGDAVPQPPSDRRGRRLAAVPVRAVAALTAAPAPSGPRTRSPRRGRRTTARRRR